MFLVHKKYKLKCFLFLKNIKDNVYAIFCYGQDPKVLVNSTLALLEELGKTNNIFWGELFTYESYTATSESDYLEDKILKQEMSWPYSVIESDRKEDLIMYQEKLKYILIDGVNFYQLTRWGIFQRIVVIRLFEPHITSVKTANECMLFLKKIRHDVYAIFCYKQDPEILVNSILALLKKFGKTKSIFWGDFLTLLNFTATSKNDYLDEKILKEEMVYLYSAIESDRKENLTIYQEELKHMLISAVQFLQITRWQTLQRIIVIRLFEPHITSVKTANECMLFLKTIKHDVYAIFCYKQDPEILVNSTLALLKEFGKTNNVFWGYLWIEWIITPTSKNDDLEEKILKEEMVYLYSAIESDRKENLTIYQEELKHMLISGVQFRQITKWERVQRIIVIRLFEPHVISVKTANEIAEKSKKPH